MKSLSKVFTVWRNKQALRIERNKRNRNIGYTLFRDSNLNRISNVLLNRARSFFCTFVINLANLKVFFLFLDPLFYTFLGDLSKRNVALS